MEFFRRALRIREQSIDQQKASVDALVAELRKDEDYLSNERAYRSALFHKSRLAAQGADIADAEKAVAVAQKVFFDKLAATGKSIEDITYTPACPICNDRGYTIGGACKCLVPTIKACMAKEGDLPHTLSSFDSFDLSLYSASDLPYADNAKTSCLNWTNKHPDITKNILLMYGETGVGKTYLAGIVANCFLDQGKTVSFYNALSVNKIFLRAHLAPINQKSAILADLYDADLLVIDDLGIEQILNNVTLEYLYELLLERANLATIITTNLSPEELKERYDDRIFSRLAGKTCKKMPMTAKTDLRLG